MNQSKHVLTVKNTKQSLSIKNSSPAKVLIFDSGVGGLSIANAVRTKHPECTLVLAKDCDYFPYGNKPESQLIERVTCVLREFQELVSADIIVIACNTVSTIALPRLRERFTVPIIGVVPAIKPAAALSQTRVIGLLGTQATVARQYTQQLCRQFAHDCVVHFCGSNELVSLAEQKAQGLVIDSNDIVECLKPLTPHSATDTVVLACTHFPLLQPELAAILPKVKNWVDSGDAIARRVSYWLKELKLNHCSRPELAYVEILQKKDNAISRSTLSIQYLQSLLNSSSHTAFHRRSKSVTV